MLLHTARLAAFLAALVTSLPAAAAFHLFQINEAYSNTSGTVQYLELTALAGGQQFTHNHTLVSTSGTSTRTFTLMGNLPGDTANRRMLIGTAGVQTAFGVTPDYIIPNAFLHTAAGTFNWGEGSDTWNHPALPTTGWSALARDGSLVTPTPQNFAGALGTLPPQVQLTEVVAGFSQAVDIRFAPGVTDRMFVAEKTGRIRIAVGNQILAADFLNVGPLINTSGERGLLGLAFHPGYATNRAFYVYYTNTNGAITIARYLRHPTDPNLADPASGVILPMSIPHASADNHNGGGLHFGPDGFLYMSTGDGGGGGDPERNGQNIGTRLGKMLRIAVDPSNPNVYTIPAGNMFPSGGTCGTTGCPETFHMGLRNPWRFSFDKLRGDHYIGDVGQGAFEEIDRRILGSGPANFGWGVYEGNACFNDSYFGVSGACNQLTNHDRPIFTYPRSEGQSITGGYVYRGSRIVGLGGWYLYGDYTFGRTWAGRPNGSGWQNVSLAPADLASVSTFGQDAAGEVYAANLGNGRIYRFDAINGAPDPAVDHDNDGVPSGIEGQEGLDYLVKDNDIFTSARLFGMQQYRDFLGREGDAAGIDFYADRINTGASTRPEVVESFLLSPEFQSGLPQVTRLYFSYFLRIPDYAGLLFQVGQFRSGVPLDVISQNFQNSPEFTNRYGSLNNDQYINLVYQNVLGRAPDPDGYNFYFNHLQNGTMTRGQMMLGFSESPEFQQLTTHDTVVVGIYVGLLRRAPEPAGLDFYVDQLQAGGTRTSIITGFVNSPEYRSRFLP